MRATCIILLDGAKRGYVADVSELHADRYDSGKITLYVKGRVEMHETPRKIRKRVRELAEGKK